MKTTATLKTAERINNSTNGNPRYFVIIETDDGEILHGNTPSDVSYCYRNWDRSERITVEYHETKTGRIVFDHIKEIA